MEVVPYGGNVLLYHVQFLIDLAQLPIDVEQETHYDVQLLAHVLIIHSSVLQSLEFLTTSDHLLLILHGIIQNCLGLLSQMDCSSILHPRPLGIGCLLLSRFLLDNFEAISGYEFDTLSDKNLIQNSDWQATAPVTPRQEISHHTSTLRDLRIKSNKIIFFFIYYTMYYSIQYYFYFYIYK